MITLSVTMKNPLAGELAAIQAINSAKKQKAQGFGVKIQDTLPSQPSAIPVRDSATEADPVKEEPKEIPATEPEQKQAATPAVGLDLKQLIQDAVTSAVAAATEPIKAELEATRVERDKAVAQVTAISGQAEQIALDAAKIATEKQAAENELAKVQKDSQLLADLGKLQGKSVTDSIADKGINFNTRTSTDDSPKGLAGELVGILSNDSLCKVNRNVLDTRSGLIAKQYDPKPASQFINAAFREASAKGLSWRDSALVKDVESWFKAHGMLGGRSVNAAGPTTGSTAPNLFLDTLSAMLRETHNASNVFWQLPITVYDPTSAPSKTVLIPRFANLTNPSALSDYLIANNTTYNPLALTTGTNSDSQSLDVTTVPVGIAQYGLGVSGSVGTRPIFIPEFYEATSLLSLMDAVDARLMQNYYRVEDLAIRTEFLKAATVLYNDAGTVTATPANVGTGDKGTFTKEFANALYTYMYAAQIPTYPDGCYALVLNPYSANNFKESLGSLYQVTTNEQLSAATSTFRMGSGVEIGRLQNYLGMYCNFHVFISNSIGVGSVDSVTVHTTTLGVGATTTYDSFAFGVGAVGRGVAAPVEIRSQGAPYGMGEGFIWTSREGFSAIDVDSTSVAPANQQTRVVRCRNTMTAV